VTGSTNGLSRGERHRLDLDKYAHDSAARVGLALRELRRQIPALRENVLWPRGTMLDISQQDTLEALLLSHPEGAPIKVLAAMMRIDASTMSRILDRMIERQLVTKVRSADDGRVLLVQATDIGRAAFAESFWPALDAYRSLLAQTFSPREIDDLSARLVELVRLFDAAIDNATEGRSADD
jgi:DNA-binding MarR family transcriptional regulator